VADYDTFAKAAVERQLVSGYLSSNRILLALTRVQTALYGALADLHGIPYLIDATTRFDGRLSGLLNKTASGTSTRVVTRVEAGSLPDDRFRIPEGWKRDRK
jgi:hypothetical protein